MGGIRTAVEGRAPARPLPLIALSQSFKSAVRLPLTPPGARSYIEIKTAMTQEQYEQAAKLAARIKVLKVASREAARSKEIIFRSVGLDGLAYKELVFSGDRSSELAECFPACGPALRNGSKARSARRRRLWLRYERPGRVRRAG